MPVISENNSSQGIARNWVAIFGNPNCGKTALFNRLTGLHHKVGNYPGVTVERKSGFLRGTDIEIRDYPGTYSLYAKSLDEKIVTDTVHEWRVPGNRPKAVIIVLDATNLSRNIYLSLQILDWNLPTIIVLNMMDEVIRKNIRIDMPGLQRHLRAYRVIPASAKSGEGISAIIEAVRKAPGSEFKIEERPRLIEIERYIHPLHPLIEFLEERIDRIGHNPTLEALSLISDFRHINYFKDMFSKEEFRRMKALLDEAKLHFDEHNIPYRALEQASRFAFIDMFITPAVGEEKISRRSRSERADKLLTHRYLGPLLMLSFLAFIFNAIFSWAEYPMNLIENLMSAMAGLGQSVLAEGPLKSLLLDGVLAGVGSVLVFFPQILLLVFFLSILEDSGYMSRMAFMMDRVLHKIGLHGRSVLPLLSGFACAIPAVMSTRTIENWRDRLITILITPLMSCSARLPVYTLLIAAFIPNRLILGFFSLQGMALMGIYFLGMFTAIFVALILKKVFRGMPSPPLTMELPPYRLPMMRSVGWQLIDRAKSFLKTAGSIILSISVVLWFLATYPKAEETLNLSPAEKIEQSFAGRLGKTIEPVIRPLGYDWKIGIGLITSFAAREVVVSTLSTLYNLSEDSETASGLITALQNDRRPDGTPVFTMLSALSLMVFFAYAAQCMATFVIVKKETNSWRWPLLMVGYMTVLAYLAALTTFQLGKLIGLE